MSKAISMQKKLALIALPFVAVVIALGAFTRLADAGLGCPDWPGCYGFLHIPTQQQDIQQANMAFPDQPYEFDKAWPEMVHRYFAGTLGLLILGLFLLSWKIRQVQSTPFKLASVLLVLIVFQAALGAWTVTEKLHPLIVMGHLLGGFTTFSLLTIFAVRVFRPANDITNNDISSFKKLTSIAIAVLFMQIALGGWTSANYAALVCTDLPICQGDWTARTDFANGFKLWGHEAETYQYGVLSLESMTAIHVSHRIGAIVTSLVILLLIVSLMKKAESSISRKMVPLFSSLLVIQVALGVSNVVFHLPLSIAVAHNGVAALLLVSLVAYRTIIWQHERQFEQQGVAHG
ncbi:heme A synthase [Pleionea sp. CnH1-48]|uniref:COX15/CtaA family protein n=1 Tax=Pleionea sp. CnH1-48 TaxID=2954494 RepID=UPI0020979B66|nr:COX15/CtaA family protein [Pleionea sp. CnH1-48]MCO7224634.1 COX15/CtaA family protein [Pleionea sp. CnH1-48]